jgi:dTDP-4-dehydrorhamnose 3,5-epimerase
MAQLTPEDIDEKVRSHVYTQDYTPKKEISGVKIIPLKNHVGEDGDFCELLHLDTGEVAEVPGFTLVQINRSRLFPKSVKAWHLHLNQDEIWYILPSQHLFVGLWDVRKGSATTGVSMRIPLGGGQSTLLYIPRGVAHGAMNLIGGPTELFYFINQRFNPQAPDERRLPWDSLGADFWQPVRD